MTVTKREKWLCVCQYGHSRSAALVRRLHGRDADAVCLGVSTASPELLAMMAAWADRIAVLDTGFAKHLPGEHQHKVVDFHVGPDRWSNPYHPELIGILDSLLRAMDARALTSPACMRAPYPTSQTDS